MSARSAAQRREVRVFVSSTFRDMHAERDELIKRVFPQLRKLCEERGVAWSEVDLRWGITDEQKAEGQVLPICLAEIQRCRPYFIGLLGERYGWVPDDVAPELLEREPWLAEHRERSVTELEMLHGVLNDPAMAQRAYFYFRAPGYIEALPPEQQPELQEVPTDAEIQQHGAAEADRRAEQRRHKLAGLKTRIRNSGLPVREDYPNPRTLGESVLHDLTEALNRDYPPGPPPDPLDREAAQQDAYAQSRAAVYIGRQEYFDRLDAHARGDGPPLVVLGESGLGKSSLLANWALRRQAEPSDDLVLMHFIGASPSSADWIAMLRRILGEFKRRFNLQQEIPESPDALRSTFADWLHMAAARGRVVLLLDALNQLEDRDGALDLVWLPPVIPAGVRLILATLPGRPLDDLARRQWPTLKVEPLQSDERRLLITQYLGQFGKRLEPAHVDQLATAAPTANPLYLRVLLEELRAHGDHFTLKQCIHDYLTTLTVEELYERVLARYEHDYERDRPGLVREAFSLLWAARRGLAESELLDLLGTDGQPLPQAHWSPLHLAAEHALVSRSGLLGFSHEYFRQAVRHRYLRTLAEQESAHLRIADYFAAKEISPRKIQELPWQLTEARAWPRLHGLLTNLPFLRAALDVDAQEVKSCWARLEGNSRLRLADFHWSELDKPDRKIEHVGVVANLLNDFRLSAKAMPLLQSLIEHYRRQGDRVYLMKVVNHLANAHKGLGNDEEAMALYVEQESICRELQRDPNQQDSIVSVGLAAAIHNQANSLFDRGDVESALARYKEAEQISRAGGHWLMLAATLGGQVNVMKQRGELDAALALHREQVQLCREHGFKSFLAQALGQKAAILQMRGDDAGACSLYQEQEQLSRELGDLLVLKDALTNQAQIAEAQGELERALALDVEAGQICRRLERWSDLHECVTRRGRCLSGLGDHAGALAVICEHAQLCRERGDERQEWYALFNASQAQYSLGQPAQTRAALAHLEARARQSDDTVALATCLYYQADLLWDEFSDRAAARAKAEEALALLARAPDRADRPNVEQLLSRIQRELLAPRHKRFLVLMTLALLTGMGVAVGFWQPWLWLIGAPVAVLSALLLAVCLFLHSQRFGKNALSRCRRRYSKVKGKLQENRYYRERGRRRLNEKQTALKALVGEISNLVQAKDMSGAARKCEPAEALVRELDDPLLLQEYLIAKVELLKKQGKHEQALDAYRHLVLSARQTGDRYLWSQALYQRAEVLQRTNDLDGAIATFEESVAVARDLGDLERLQEALEALAKTWALRENAEKALACFREHEVVCRKIPAPKALQRSLLRQAQILFARKELEATLSLLTEQERICRAAPDLQNSLQIGLALQAEIFLAREERDKAVERLREREAICRSSNNDQGLIQCLSRMCDIFQQQGERLKIGPLMEEIERLARKTGGQVQAQMAQLMHALVHLNNTTDLVQLQAQLCEQERLQREQGQRRNLAYVLAQQANLLEAQGELRQAHAPWHEAAAIYREVKDMAGLQVVLGREAGLLKKLDDLAVAKELLKERESVCRTLADRKALEECLNQQAELLLADGDLSGGVARYQELARIAREQGDTAKQEELLGKPTSLIDSIAKLAKELQEAGDLPGALTLYRQQEPLCAQIGDLERRQQSLGAQGLILKQQKDLPGALALFQHQEQVCRELGDPDKLQYCLTEQAVIHFFLKNNEQALTICRETERLCREVGNLPALQENLGRQAILVALQGDTPGAASLFQQQRELCRQSGDRQALLELLEQQVTIHVELGELQGALLANREMAQLCRESNEPAALAKVLKQQASFRGQQADALREQGDLAGALSLQQQREQIARELGDQRELVIVLGCQGSILTSQGQTDEALAIYRQAEQICRETDFKEGLATVLGKQLQIHWERKDSETAFALACEREQVCRAIGDTFGVSRSLDIQASVRYGRGDQEGALTLYRQEEPLFRDLADVPALQICLGNQALILEQKGDLRATLRLHEEIGRLYGERGNAKGLLDSLGKQIKLAETLGDLDLRLAVYQRQEQAFEAQQMKQEWRAALRNQALIHRARGSLEDALTALAAEEALCRELADDHALAGCLIEQAGMLSSAGRLDPALSKYVEAMAICRRHDWKPGLRISLDGQVYILQSQRRWDSTLSLAQELEGVCQEQNFAAGLHRALYFQAVARRGRGELDLALTIYRQVEQLSRQHPLTNILPASLIDQAALLQQAGNAAPALEAAEQAVSFGRQLNDPFTLASLLTTLASVLQALGRADEALTVYTEQQELYERAGRRDCVQQALGNRANLHFARGEHGTADGLFAGQEQIARARQDRAGIAAALYARGECARLQSQWDAALHRYGAALELDPSLMAAYQMRGYVRLQLQDWDGAISDFSRSIQLARQQGFDCTNLLLDRAWTYYETNRDQEAFDDYRAANEGKPGDANVLVAWGTALGFVGQWDQAKETIDKALALAPESSTAFEMRAMARCFLGDLAGAVDDATQAIQLNDRIANHFDMRAWARIRLGAWQAAVEDCLQTIERDAAHPFVYSNLALARWGLGQAEAALQALHQLLDVQLLGLALLAPRRSRLHCFAWGAVVEDWSGAVRSRPDGLAHLGRGIAAWLAGQREPAVVDLKQASICDPRLRTESERILALISRENVQAT